MLAPMFLCPLLAMVAIAAAAPIDDMENLTTSCENTANIIDTSLNSSTAMNTSDLIQTIIWQVGASLSNLEAENTPSTQPDNTTESLDIPYFDYIDAILNLSEAVIRRGLVAHGETNSDVFNTLQSLASVVQTYGMQLGNNNLISRSAFIRTLTAGNSLVDAESVWAGSGNSSRS